MKRIAIHSAPRSGSSWLGTLIDAHPSILFKFQPLFSYELKGALKEDSSKKEISDFFNSLSKTNSNFLDREEEKANGIVPSFEKQKIESIAYKEVRYHHLLKNLMFKDSEIKVIGLVRDPRAVIYSWWKAPREFDKGLGWDIHEEWYHASKKNKDKVEEFYGFKKWLELVRIFENLQEKYPDRLKIIKYSDLLSDSINQLNDLMNFLDLKVDPQQLIFLTESKKKHNDDPYAVYKSKQVDRTWVDKLPNEIAEAIFNKLQNSSLEKYLDEF